VRDETKYHKMLAFGAALPGLRARTDRDLAAPGLPRDKVLAAVVRLLETSFIRVGNDEYARENKSFGLTTLRDEHAVIRGADVRFHFRGKSGKEHTVEIHDRRLAQIVKRCQDLPGHELFQYVDESGERQRVHSGDVNEYLRSITAQDFTAKDFRTWAGTMLAARALEAMAREGVATRRKQAIVRAIESVAERLGNTTAVCRRCYVHPAVLDAFLEGALLEGLRARVGRAAGERWSALAPEEQAVMRLLQARVDREREPLEAKLAKSLRATRSPAGRRKLRAA
jgi:DNA topoisomerase-1